MDDRELLAAYVSSQSAKAFEEIVRANAGIVYAAARRQVRDAHLAEDVTQAVFILLTKKAKRVQGSLAGWLIVATRYASRDALKIARRRQIHERAAAQMPATTSEQPSPRWDEYAEHLDEALTKLPASDRDAIALRYLREMKVQEVAQAIGITPAAAEKRVNRALSRLRAILSARAAAPAIAMLATELAARGAEAAPVSLVQSITATVATGKGLLAASIAQKASAAMFWAKAKLAACIITAIGVTGTAVALAAIVIERNSGAAPPAAAAPVTAAPPAVLSAMPETPETNLPGSIRVATYSVMLNQAGADIVQPVLTPESSPSIGYLLMRCDALALRAALRKAIDAKGIEDYSQSLVADVPPPMKPYPTPPQMNLPWSWLILGDPLTDSAVSTQAFGDASEKSDRFEVKPSADGRSASVKMNFDQISLQFSARVRLRMAQIGIGTPKEVVSLGADTDVQTGQCLVFMRQYRLDHAPDLPRQIPFFHLIVLESYKSEESERGAFASQTSPAWWLSQGPARIHQWTHVAYAWWALAAKAKAQSSEQTFTLSDGKTIRLTSLCDAGKWPGCWWDVGGNSLPIQEFVPANGDPPNNLYGKVLLRGLQSEVAKEMPQDQMRLPPDGQPFDLNTGQFPIMDRATLSVGSEVGNWQEAGRMKLGETGHFGDIQITIVHSPGPRGDPNLLETKLQHTSNQAVYVSAIAADGKEYFDWLHQSPAAIEATVPNSPEGGTMYDAIGDFGSELDLKDISYFRVMERKRQFVVFSHFAGEPKINPAVNASP